MKITITTRITKSHGVAFDLYYRWKGQRYRPLLGHNLTKEQAQAAALEMIRKIQSGVAQLRTSKAVSFRDMLHLYWSSLKVKNRIDLARPEGIIKNHLQPRFGDRPLSSLTAQDGLDYLVGRQQAGAKAGTSGESGKS